MPRMFSYVVQHDTGLAPNPDDGCCTLAVCKFGSPAHRNIVELAEVGDWFVGTGGADLRKSSGHGTLVYAMRVAEMMSLQAYKRDEMLNYREDALFVHAAPAPPNGRCSRCFTLTSDNEQFRSAPFHRSDSNTIWRRAVPNSRAMSVRRSSLISKRGLKSSV